MTSHYDMVERMLTSTRDDAVHLALAYIQGRALEAGDRVERQTRKRGGKTLLCERRGDLVACLNAMIAELKLHIDAIEEQP